VVKLTELVQLLHSHLEVAAFQDYCPNGLQIEGRSEVRHVVTGVTASQALIDAAIARDADALLVHHGYFWKGESLPLTGIKGRRVASLMQRGISLLAYHLPLDAHPVHGNNQQLAEVLDFDVTGSMEGGGWSFGLTGQLRQAWEARELAAHLEQRLGQRPLHLQGHDRPIRTLAWCTGAAQGGIVRAAELGVDAYISGEVSEQTLHQARELGIDYFAAGHHATERYGVKALGGWLAANLGIECEFVDIHNPV
jgi:dinuclear metal center YbgI/SA1388 family protein